MNLYEIEKAALAALREAGIPGSYRIYESGSVERTRDELADYGMRAQRAEALLRQRRKAELLLLHASGDAIDDVADVMNWLRGEKIYAQADRLRTIVGRPARARPRATTEPDTAIREVARTWK